MAMVDVTVRGAGIFGLSIALGLRATRCQGAGCRSVWPRCRLQRRSGRRARPACTRKLECQKGVPIRQPDHGRAVLETGRGHGRRLSRICTAGTVATHCRRTHPGAGPCARWHRSRSLGRAALTGGSLTHRQSARGVPPALQALSFMIR